MAGWIKTPKWDHLCAFDVETTISSNEMVGPDCRHFENKIVLLGLMTENAGFICDGVGTTEEVWVPNLNKSGVPSPSEYKDMVVCGHNIKFDLHAINNNRHFIALSTSFMGAEIWDTQVGSYLISAQKLVSPSLEEAAEQAGIPFTKDPEVKLAFINGLGADKVHPDMLVEYLKGDLRTTFDVARWQIKECIARGLMPLAVSMMRAVKALASIEQNGLVVDEDEVKARIRANEAQIAFCEGLIRGHLQKMGAPKEFLKDFNIGSGKHWELVINGGLYAYHERELVGKYKNGNDKYLNVRKEVKVPSCVDSIVKVMYLGKFDAEFIDKCVSACNTFKMGDDSILFTAIAKHKKYIKINNTYLEPILARQEAYGGMIFPNFNTTITKTGRLSSSNPNFQNMEGKSDESAKQVFIPRPGKVFVELDYKQMEVLALYLLSGCPALGRALKDGVDIHNETGKIALGHVPKPEERRAIKAVNFGLIYGGGANTLAAQAGLSVEVTKKCIEAFYTLYPGVKKWKDEYFKDVMDSKSYYEKMMLGTKPKEFKEVATPTGRLLSYEVYEPTQRWQRKASCSPTQVANYPVQSLATGDISQTMLWVLKDLLSKKFGLSAYIVNTVHDSFLIECNYDIQDEVIAYCTEVLESADRIVNRLYGIESDVKFKVEHTVYRKRWGMKDKK